MSLRRPSRRLGRRAVLRGGLAALGTYVVGGSSSAVVSGPALGCTNVCDLEPEKLKEPRREWLQAARVAGLEAHAHMSDCEIATSVDRIAETGATVIEVDTNLSAYLSEEQFAKEVETLDVIARACHMRGIRAVVYYPALEVLSAHADKTPHTMAKDHPDWVQIGIDGKPNVFVGGGGHVFWVEPGVESAWMCPASGYADYFLARCERLAQTALDGLWIDVPLLSDIKGLLPCVDPKCRELFKSQTGLEAPLPFDVETVPEAEREAKDPIRWDDPAFRRWIVWRHQLIHDFEQRLLRALKAVRSEFELIVETVTMDYNGGTAQGLDGASHDDGGVFRVWEVDAVSDAEAMRGGAADDWICTAVMMRHGAGACGQRPTWAFTYGLEPEDAEYVMGLAITAGVGPYESKIPVMNATVGPEYRARMYEWLARQEDAYHAETASEVAVLFSTPSRDFVDRNAGTGLYATTQNKADKLWWAGTYGDNNSVYKLSYVGDYRGACKALIHAHVPYDTLAIPHLAARRRRFRAILAPSIAAISEADAAELVAFVQEGGALVLTGPAPGRYDELGAERPKPLLLDRFGFSTAPPPEFAEMWTERPMGSGFVLYTSELAGFLYFTAEDNRVFDPLVKLVDEATAGGLVQTNAPPAVVMSVRRGPGVTYLLVSNLHGLGSKGVGRFTPEDARFQVSVRLRPGETAKRVHLSEPTVGAFDREIAFKQNADRVSFDLAVHAVMIARIHT